MVFSYTGVAYSLLFFAATFLACRFFQYWQKKKDTVSKLFFLFIIPIDLFLLINSITGLFFANNINLIGYVQIISPLLQAIGFGILLYTIIYLKFTKISPWLGFFLIFVLGLLSAIMAKPLSALLMPSGSIRFGEETGSLLFLIVRISIYFPLIGFFLILNEQYKQTKDPMVRRRALGMTFLFLIGLGGGFLDFLGIDPFIRDMANMILSIFLILLIIITQKSSDYEEKDMLQSSKIK